jgi:predicted Rossmann fold nucleotide-binding protein DprA/Smf involved in DNA uptake
VVLDAEDVLDALLGADRDRAPAPALPGLDPVARRLLDAVASGHGRLDQLATTPAEGDAVRRGLVRLELAGLVRREAGGRWVALASAS